MMGVEKIYIVGDIHGCLEMLERLLDKIGWSPVNDRLIFLGDYIDRGKNSRGVLDLLLEISRSSSLVQFLIGNHENIFLEYLNTGRIMGFILNGGDATLESYRAVESSGGGVDIPQEHLAFLRSLEHWIELDDYYVVHAGFRPGVDVERQSFEDLIWIRDTFIFSDYDFGKKVIFGHTPFSKPLLMANKIGLDTGAVYGNKLTCLELPAFKFHFVEA